MGCEAIRGDPAGSAPAPGGHNCRHFTRLRQPATHYHYCASCLHLFTIILILAHTFMIHEQSKIDYPSLDLHISVKRDRQDVGFYLSLAVSLWLQLHEFRTGFTADHLSVLLGFVTNNLLGPEAANSMLYMVKGIIK